MFPKPTFAQVARRFLAAIDHPTGKAHCLCNNPAQPDMMAVAYRSSGCDLLVTVYNGCHEQVRQQTFDFSAGPDKFLWWACAQGYINWDSADGVLQDMCACGQPWYNCVCQPPLCDCLRLGFDSAAEAAEAASRVRSQHAAAPPPRRM